MKKEKRKEKKGQGQIIREGRKNEVL